jgi:hypothetical protein
MRRGSALPVVFIFSLIIGVLLRGFADLLHNPYCLIGFVGQMPDEGDEKLLIITKIECI